MADENDMNKGASLFADPGEQGGAGGEGEGAAGGQGGGEDQQAGQQQQSGRVELSPEAIQDLAKAVSSGRGAPPEKQLSQEELDTMFNIYRPTPEIFKQLREGDEAAVMAAVTQIAHGAARQAVTLAAYQLQQEMAKVNSSMKPALDFAYEQQMEKLKGEFFQKYPDLKGYDPILTAIRDKYIQEGKQFKDKETAFKTLAEEAKKVLATLPGFKAGENNGGGGTQNPPSSQKGSAMPSLASGRGGAGAGDRPASGGQQNTAKRIFS